MILNFAFQLAASAFQGRRFAPLELARPRGPGLGAAGRLQRAKQRVVRKPVTLLFDEPPQICAFGILEPGLKAPESLAQAPLAIANRRWKVRVSRAFEGSWVQHLPELEQPALDEHLQAQQQRAAGESRRAVVRRCASAERADRQHLPVTLTRADQKIHEQSSLGSQIPDAVRTG